MLLCEMGIEDIEKEIKSRGCDVAPHCLYRIKRRFGAVSPESFLFDFDIAFRRYKNRAKDVKRRKKLRLSSNGVVYRNEYFVKSHGITFVFSKNRLISVYVELK